MKRVGVFFKCEWNHAMAWHHGENGGGHLGFLLYLLAWAGVVGMLIAVPLVKAFAAWGVALAVVGAPFALVAILCFFLLLEKTEAHLRGSKAD